MKNVVLYPLKMSHFIATYEACVPMAEVFNVVSYKSKSINFDIPGNLEAQGMLYASYSNATREPEIKARNLFSADLAAEFANYFDDEEEEMETSEFLQDFVQSTTTSEKTEQIEYEDEVFYNYGAEVRVQNNLSYVAKVNRGKIIFWARTEIFGKKNKFRKIEILAKSQIFSQKSKL